MIFGEIHPQSGIIERVCTKNLKATLLFIDFAKAFDSIHRAKKKQILLVYGFRTETITVIMMVYRNMKVKIHTPDGDTDFFLTLLLEFCEEIH